MMPNLPVQHDSDIEYSQRLTAHDIVIIDHYLDKVVDVLSPIADGIAAKLVAASIFDDIHRELLKNERLETDKALRIINLLKKVDQGKTGLRMALSLARADSIYDEMFVFPPESSSGDVDMLTDDIESMDITSATTSTAKDHSALSDNNVNAFDKELRNWYQESYVVDPRLITSRSTSQKRVDKIYVELVWKDNEDSEEVIDHEKVLENLQLDLTKASRIAVITGEAGMGKTTVVKKICDEWATNYGRSSLFKLVLALPLRLLNNQKPHISIIQAILHYFATHYGSWFPSLRNKDTFDEIEAYCEEYAKDILYLLDGYDEYEGSNDQIDQLRQRYGFDSNFRSVLIVTSRPVALAKIGARRYHFHLDGFSDASIAKFIGKYITPRAKPNELLMRLKEGHRLELAKTPLLLKMMCEIWQNLPAERRNLPASKRDLYNKFRDFMIERAIRDNRLTTDRLHILQELHEVGKICYEELMAKPGGNLVWHFSCIEPYYDHLQQIGLLCTYEGESSDYMLSEYVMLKHKTFQEYLAAYYIEDCALPSTLEPQANGNVVSRFLKRSIEKIGASIRSLTNNHGDIREDACTSIDEASPRKIARQRKTNFEFQDQSSSNDTFTMEEQFATPTHAQMIELINICQFIKDNEVMSKLRLTDENTYNDPLISCAVARSLAGDTIHICPINAGLRTSDSGSQINRIVICNVNCDTPGELKEILGRDKSPSIRCKVMINALNLKNDNHVRLLGETLHTLQSICHNSTFECSVFVPPNITAPNLSAVMALDEQRPNFWRNSIHIHGDISITANIDLYRLGMWPLVHRMELYNVRINVANLVALINSKLTQWPNLRMLSLRRNGFTNQDYIDISDQCVNSSTDSLPLMIQPDDPFDLTDHCIGKISKLMIHLTRGHTKTYLGLCGVQNFAERESIFQELFVVVINTRRLGRTIPRIEIDLNECGLQDSHCDIIARCLTQLGYWPSCSLSLVLQSNNISVKKRDELLEEMNRRLFIKVVI